MTPELIQGKRVQADYECDDDKSDDEVYPTTTQTMKDRDSEARAEELILKILEWRMKYETFWLCFMTTEKRKKP